MDEKKYLDADHLLTALSVFNDHDNGNPHFLNGIRTAEKIIKDAPAADVRPVKRGKWKKHYGDHEAFGERPFCLYCSVCNAITVLPFNFCPHCGADLRPVTDDGQ